MKTYNVHFSGYYGYDIKVEAESEEEAIDKATELFEEVPASELNFEAAQEDVWEIKK